MADSQTENKLHEIPVIEVKNNTSAPFRFNAQAPEFVPRSQTQMPIPSYFYPCFDILGGGINGSEWFYTQDQEPFRFVPASSLVLPNCSNNLLNDDLQQKIIKQVEYQFSDMNLLANDSFRKHINKDPEGFVPVSVIASSKKIKSLTSNSHLLTQALRSSSKLVISGDGKKVRRKNLSTERDKEELQSRTVVAENLPEDHSHRNLEKLFGAVGRVKTIRLCHPQESNSSRSKGDVFISAKLHALVEYETSEIAESAVEKLNDERDWRKGLRVRLLLRCSPKSVLKNRKSEFDGILEEDEATPTELLEDYCQLNNTELSTGSNPEENSGSSARKGWARGRGKLSRGRSQNHSGRGLLSPTSQASGSFSCEASTKQATKGPRMPGGTRGFTMGRGKPVSDLGLFSDK